MSVKIDAKVLGIKKLVEVKESTKNVQRAMLIQKEIVNSEYSSRELAEKDEDALTLDDMNASLEANFDLIESINAFVAKVLRLSDEQVELLEEELEQDEVMGITSELITKLLHIEVSEEDKEVADKSLKD